MMSVPKETLAVKPSIMVYSPKLLASTRVVLVSLVCRLRVAMGLATVAPKLLLAVKLPLASFTGTTGTMDRMLATIPLGATSARVVLPFR
ncbi:hypothetical protein D3C85_1292780 [compost metagenome]